MALGMSVGLGLGHSVLAGDPAHPPQKGAELPPIFGPFLLWSKGWMHQNATWYGGRPRPRPHCASWGPRSPQEGGTAPIFGTSILWPNGWIDQGDTW